MARVARKTSKKLSDEAAPLSETLFGLEGVAEQLLEAFHSGRQHHAVMLSGLRGIGKASLATQFAKYVLQYGDKSTHTAQAHILLNPIQGQRAGLVAQNAHPDFFMLRSFTTTTAKPSISVEASRGLLPFLGSRPALGGWRVVLIDAIDEMNRNAANAVLKSLEEPPANTLFLLVCHSQGQLLPTIRSRCLILPVKPLSAEDIAKATALQCPDTELDKLTQMAALAGGTVARALSLVQGNGFEVAQETLALLSELPNLPRSKVLALSEKAKGAEGRVVFEAFVEQCKALLFRLPQASRFNTAYDRDIATSLGLGASDQSGLDALPRLWETITRISSETAIMNLDRKQAMRDILFAFEEQAKQALERQNLSLF